MTGSAPTRNHQAVVPAPGAVAPSAYAPLRRALFRLAGFIGLPKPGEMRKQMQGCLSLSCRSTPAQGTEPDGCRLISREPEEKHNVKESTGQRAGRRGTRLADGPWAARPPD